MINQNTMKPVGSQLLATAHMVFNTNIRPTKNALQNITVC